MTIDVVQCTVPMVSASVNNPYDMSWHGAQHCNSFLDASTQHSGDWLFAISIASCGLKLDDEAVRLADHCHCGSVVDA